MRCSATSRDARFESGSAGPRFPLHPAMGGCRLIYNGIIGLFARDDIEGMKPESREPRVRPGGIDPLCGR